MTGAPLGCRSVHDNLTTGHGPLTTKLWQANQKSQRRRASPSFRLVSYDDVGFVGVRGRCIGSSEFAGSASVSSPTKD